MKNAIAVLVCTLIGFESIDSYEEPCVDTQIDLPQTSIGVDVVRASFAEDQSDTEKETNPEQIRVEALKKALQKRSLEKNRIVDERVAVSVEWLLTRESFVRRPLGEHADYFLGFVAGRLQVAIPDWWRELVRGGTIVDGGVFFQDVKLHDLWKKAGVNNEWHFSGCDQLAVEGERMMLEDSQFFLGLDNVPLRKTTRCQLRAKNFDRHFKSEASGNRAWSPETDDAVAISISEDFSAVVLQCPIRPFSKDPQIYGFKTKTGEVLWNQPLATGRLHGHGTIGVEEISSYTELTADEKRVFVWSANFFSATLQVFDKENGKILATFVSTDANNIDEFGESTEE